jgi:exodeoxyribonuclease-3
MPSVEFFSWNVNGIRACARQGFVTSLMEFKPDVVGLQEVRATRDQVPEDLCKLADYPFQYYMDAEKKGYSGVGILSKTEPQNVFMGIGSNNFDREGRVIAAVFNKFIFASAYFPNSRDKGLRIEYKLEFCDAIHSWLMSLLKKYPSHTLILCGDFNIAHNEIDLARPKENQETAGFLPGERAWMSKFLSAGWMDSFRMLHPEAIKYSWWSARTNARPRNIGWRIDYHTVYNTDPSKITKAEVLDQVYGSDHCPVTLTLEV